MDSRLLWEMLEEIGIPALHEAGMNAATTPMKSGRASTFGQRRGDYGTGGCADPRTGVNYDPGLGLTSYVLVSLWPPRVAVTVKIYAAQLG